ncbi:MAG TPA: MBL fold metallo-hydrolase [Papillibacter sp.]|jgi:glyoxylase-like metal-dependent hydrolase (beta-lactamase superfamily II)|nr:MBL fold metallo-hydrolase [Papillibacter sp.]
MLEHNMPLETVQICESAYRIEDNGVRCHLFIGTEKALLVDTGFGESGSLMEKVRALTDKPVMLVITHADGDHIGGNGEFETAHMHPAEMAYYVTRSKEKNPSVSALWEGDVIDIGGRCLEVIHIPGHTPGSIALLDRENRILVSGDTVSEASIYMFGEVRHLGAYIATLEKLMKMRDLFDEIYPSHGPFPLSPAQIDRVHAAALKLAAGELSPQEPPKSIPAKMYVGDGASFYYYAF